MTHTVRPVAPTFMRLDVRNQWQQSPTSHDVVADLAEGGLRLGSADQRAIPFTELGGTFGGITRPTGLAVGPDGRLFLADPGGHQVLGYTPHEQSFRPLWKPDPLAPAHDEDCANGYAAQEPGPYDLKNPRGIVFSDTGELVVADTGHGRIIFYAWPQLQVRHILEIPGGEPWDIAYDSSGQLYVADAATGRVWRYDCLERLDTSYLGGAGLLQRPRHLAIDDQDQVFVLDEGLGEVIALNQRGKVKTGFQAWQLLDHNFPLPLLLDEEGLWLQQQHLPNCPPLHLVGLEVDRSGRLQGMGGMLLARPRGVTYPRSGRYMSQALDSDIFDCAWHRIVLDADVPETTTITVRTLTSASLLEPERVDSLPLSRWSTPITISPDSRGEVLIQSASGRYLWLMLELGSNGDTTPLIRSITIYAPRLSSLAYLPPVFQEDPVNASFLDRYLSYFDTVFAEIETQIEQFTGYLDPDAVPAEGFLSWLASWLDLNYLSEWSESTRRTFIRRAIELYKQRGVMSGLQEVLRLHTGLQAPQPIIIEHFRLRDYEKRRETGVEDMPQNGFYIAGRPLQPSDAAGKDEIAHHFTIVFPSQAVPDQDALETLEQLIATQKPAHTCCQIRVVQPGIRIGCQSVVGVDTLLGDYQSEPLGDLVLGQSGLLTPTQGYRFELGQSRLLFP